MCRKDGLARERLQHTHCIALLDKLARRGRTRKAGG
jgi:hypothetical protein